MKSFEYQSSPVLFSIPEELGFLSIRPGSRVLEVGCGTGAVCRYLAQRFPESTIIGCDISEASIDFARALASLFPNISFSCQDATALSYAAASFDAIICRFVLKQLSAAQRRALLAQLHRCLKPGGTLTILALDGFLLHLSPQTALVTEGIGLLKAYPGIDLQLGQTLLPALSASGFVVREESCSTLRVRGGEENSVSRFVAAQLQEHVGLFASLFAGNARGVASEDVDGEGDLAEARAWDFVREYLATLREPHGDFFFHKRMVHVEKARQGVGAVQDATPSATRSARSEDAAALPSWYATVLRTSKGGTSMSKATCANCARPISMQRPRCLYCGHENTPAVSEGAIHAEDLISTDLSYLDEFSEGCSDLLILAGPFRPLSQGANPRWRPSLAADLQQASGEILYTIRQRLLQGMPIPLRSGCTPRQARALLQQLAAQKIAASAISEETLLQIPTKQELVSLSLEEKEAFGVDRNGLTWSLPYHDIFAMIFGKLQRRRSKTTVKEHIQVNPRHGMRVKKERRTHRTQDEELVLDLYSFSHPQGMRLANKLDLSTFGDLQREFRLHVFERMIETLRQRAPRSLFDNCFKAAISSQEARSRREKRFEQMNPTQRDLDTPLHADVQDNFAQFERYTRQVYLHFKQLWLASGHGSWDARLG